MRVPLLIPVCILLSPLYYFQHQILFIFPKTPRYKALSKLARWLITRTNTLAGEMNQCSGLTIYERTREHWRNKIMADDMRNQDMNKKAHRALLVKLIYPLQTSFATD